MMGKQPYLFEEEKGGTGSPFKGSDAREDQQNSPLSGGNTRSAIDLHNTPTKPKLRRGSSLRNFKQSSMSQSQSPQHKQHKLQVKSTSRVRLPEIRRSQSFEFEKSGTKGGYLKKYHQ